MKKNIVVTAKWGAKGWRGAVMANGSFLDIYTECEDIEWAVKNAILLSGMKLEEEGAKATIIIDLETENGTNSGSEKVAPRHPAKSK